MIMVTLFVPYLREFVAAVTVTQLHQHQFSVMIFMYSTVVYLSLFLSEPRLNQGNNRVRLDLTILLYLNYLLMLLTDYVQDSVHY
jgi:hypothetical protein